MTRTAATAPLNMPLFPTGSTLQALPVAPSIDPRLGVANIDPMGNMQAGIDFAGQFARLGQLKDKLALEDITRKADAAKQKAMEAEADLMHKNLSTQYAVLQAQNENALRDQAIKAAQGGALQNVVVGTPANPGTAQIDADTVRSQSYTNNYMAQLFQKSIQENLGAGAPKSPAQVATDAVSAPPPAVPVKPVNDSFFEPNSQVSYGDYRDLVKRNLMLKKILAKESPIVLPEEIDKAAGLTTKPETFIGPDNRTYGVDVTYGPGGVRFARSTPVPKDISPERKTELDRAPELADTNQALAAVDQTIAAVTAYKAANAGGALQTVAQVLGSSPANGVLNSAKRLSGQAMQSKATQDVAAQLENLRGVFESSQRASELKGFASSVPAAVDLSNPDNALARLTALRASLKTRADTLQSNTASSAITSGNKPSPSATQDGKIGYVGNHQYRFNASTNSWVLVQ